MRKLPSLYIETTPTINAYAMGIANYSIVLCSGLIDTLDEPELMAILGHELGHVKCEHQLYKTMAYLITTFGDAVFSQAKIPGIDLVLSASRIGLEFALMDWSRKAELSCDRAALLATQNVSTVATALAKLAGYSHRYAAELSLDETEQQYESYHELGNDSLLLKLIRLRAMMTETHPYPVVRVKQIRAWAKSEEYQRILSGKYRRSQPELPSDGCWRNVRVETPRGRSCTKCNYPCAEDFAFRSACQTSVREAPLICSRCRQLVDANWAACISCGSWLTHTHTAIPE